MNTILFYDTETTGLPFWQIPSGDKSQPHIVQFAGILADADTRKVISSIDVIVKPDGYEIPQDTIEVHGITNELANKVGLPEKDVVTMAVNLCGGAKRVAHNRTFDQRIIRIQLKRYGFSEQEIDTWAEKDDHFCTMYESKEIVAIPAAGRGRYKSPTLSEAYKFFTGKELENAHSAMVDATACMEIYWAIQDMQAKQKTA